MAHTWWVALALVPLLGAAAYGFHESGGDDRRGKANMSVTHGLVFQDFRIQFNLSLTNSFDDGHNVEMTLELPDLGPFPDPEGDGGWTITRDEDGACRLEGDERFVCFWETFPAHAERDVRVVGDASCLCGAREIDFVVTADNEYDERDNSQVILFDWPCNTPQGAMGAEVDTLVDGDRALVDIRLRHAGPPEAWPLFGAEIYADMPLLGSDWSIVSESAQAFGHWSCFVHLNDDLFCDLVQMNSGGFLHVQLEAARGDACGAHQFQVVFTSDSAERRFVNGAVNFAPCEDDDRGEGAARLEASAFPSRDGDLGAFDLVVRNEGPATAHNVRVLAEMPDLAVPWSSDGLDPRCQFEERDLIECNLPHLAPGAAWTAHVWTNVAHWCGEPVANVLKVTWDRQASGPDVGASEELAMHPCHDGHESDARVTAVPHNGKNWVIITWNVTAQGDLPSHDVVLTSTLPHLGGVRWVVHGEDWEYCSLTFNDLRCDFDTIPAGVKRQVWVKAYQHHDDCGFDVVHGHLDSRADTNDDNDHAAATIVPPWKLHQERSGAGGHGH